MSTQVIEFQENSKMKYLYNRLELLLEMTGYDLSYQPFKKYGLYIYLEDRFFLYGAGKITEKRLMIFIENVINYRVKVTNPNDFNYNKKYFHEQYDCFMVYEYVVFTFLIINKNEEHLLIPFLKDKKYTINTIKIAACIRDGKVLTVNETKKLIDESEKGKQRKYLESIAGWKPNQGGFTENYVISSFSNMHFGPNCRDIKKKYKELAKKYHPDKGGDGLMFRAITSAKEYLIGESNQ